jgi:hypothetical protein
MQRTTPWGELRNRIEAGWEELEDATLELRGDGDRD